MSFELQSNWQNSECLKFVWNVYCVITNHKQDNQLQKPQKMSVTINFVSGFALSQDTPSVFLYYWKSKYLPVFCIESWEAHGYCAHLWVQFFWISPYICGGYFRRVILKQRWIKFSFLNLLFLWMVDQFHVWQWEKQT